MPDYNWSRFTKRINIHAPVKKIYTAWSTRVGMEDWFLRLSEFTGATGAPKTNDEGIKKGDHYKWLWHGWPDATVEHGEILEANEKDFLKFTFGGGSNSPMTVSVRIYPEQDTTIVELTQENIPEDENGKTQYHLGCMEGWTFYLANLKSIMEGGIDLRNKNESLNKVINA